MLNPPPKTNRFLEEQMLFFDKSRTKLSKLCLHNEESFKIQHKALLTRGVRSSSKISHECLHIGDIVQLLLDRGFEKNVRIKIHLFEWFADFLCFRRVS